MSNKPIALWLTDTHLSQNTIAINISIYRQAVKIAKEMGVKVVYHGGDIFESRASQPQEVLYVFSTILDMFHDNGLSIVIIPGNHDKTDYRSEKSFLVPYKDHPSLTLVERYHIFDINNDLCFYMLPYFDEKLQLRDRLNALESKVDKNRKSIGMFHAAFNGVRNNDNSVIESSITPKAFDLSFSGHYHDRQVLNDGKLVYTGSSHQASFGEDEDKGFTIIYEDGSYSHVKSEFKRFVTIRLDKITQSDIDLIKSTHCDDNVKILSYEKVGGVLRSELSSIGVKVDEKSSSLKTTPSNEKINHGNIIPEFEVWCKSNGMSNTKYAIKTIKKAYGTTS